ncbi:hypothetical protein B0O80DRAFT_440368 [Mortierella sp. GBAus27b]|nr:hypothetical protein B0O80DRAFT_440368 [Mortierella sp. GBAus27b]
MLPHLTPRSPAHQRAHQHYSTSCPLNCPARGAPHQSQHYNAPARHTSQFDSSVLHPAFSGLFFQQRRVHTTQTSASASPSSPPPTGAGPTMDPSRISPIFFGYSSNPDKPKM